MDGPHFPGESVYAMAFDGRAGRRRILAAPMSYHWGSVVRASDDFGATWTAPDRQNVRFPEGSELALKQVWQLCPGPADDPDLLYCGVEPTALFVSDDAGESWSPVDGLLAHEHRPHWHPGGGGQCLHTIVLDPADPRRLLVAMSTGGVYRSDDGGATWQPRNRGVRAEFLPDSYPEFGQCVHKVVHHPARPGRLFLQNHWGLYRSDDWGDSWRDVADGVPSDFGFAMQMHPHDPDTVFIVPLESDGFRCVPEARLRVYRAAGRRAAAGACLRDRAARRADGRRARPGGDLLRHAQRQAVRLRRRRRHVDRDRRRPAVHRLREGGGGRRAGRRRGALSAAAPMGITVELPAALQAYARGTEVALPADACATVADALAALGARHPGVVDRMMTERGELRPHVNVFVGERDIRHLNGLETPLADGATIVVVPSVSGG
jgi:molybdopterin converting factor small subunit